MNRTIDGKFSRYLNPAQIEFGWRNRLSAPFLPLAQLHTNGVSFTMTFGSNWDVNGLKNAFNIEVNRLDPQCSIEWLEVNS